MRILYMKNKKVFLLIIVLLLLIGGYTLSRFLMNRYQPLKDKVDDISYNITGKVKYDYDYSWVKDNILVAHAFGGKGSKTYTNALEAFVYNYDLGHRAFEVDFDLTTDGITICSHDEDYWRYITNNENTGVEYSYDTFKNTPLFTDYTPMDYMDIINLLNDHKDIYIITDTKYHDKDSVHQQFTQFVDYAKKVNPEVLDRLIPQIYTKQMLDYVMEIHQFRSLIFTLYQTQWEAKDIADFCKRNGIGFITVSTAYVSEDNEVVDIWKANNINIGVHTVNEKQEADMLLEKGIDMIYTDFLDPSSFKKE